MLISSSIYLPCRGLRKNKSSCNIWINCGSLWIGCCRNQVINRFKKDYTDSSWKIVTQVGVENIFPNAISNEGVPKLAITPWRESQWKFVLYLPISCVFSRHVIWDTSVVIFFHFIVSSRISLIYSGLRMHFISVSLLFLIKPIKGL